MISTAAPLRVDWFRVLADLKAVGYGLRDIAHFTGIPRSTLLTYRAGSEPGYSTGQKLVAFWAQATERDPAAVPMVSPYSYRA